MNSIYCIAPYKYHGQWVFDDPRVGLVREALVAGADTLLDKLSNNAERATVLFSANQFPGSERLRLMRSDKTGSDYVHESGHKLWLCPALFLYFDEAPDNLYIQVKA